MRPQMITVSGINKTYQGYDIDHKESGLVLWIKNATKLTANRATSVQALQDVSFHVERGEVFGIFGSNGAGKTTLIKILSGLLLPEEGSVQINGHTGANQIKEQISYISTNGWMGLEWQLTVRENMVLYGTMFGIPRARLGVQCDAALQRFDMYEARGKYISELSAGMRQKVTLARGFLLDRPILYLDEPTVSLDVPSALAFRDMLAGYVSARTKTVLVTSHNALDLQHCDRLLLLHRGRIVALGTMDELKTPLQGVAALHVTCAGPQETDSVGLRENGGVDQMRQELLDLDGVRNVWMGAINGQGQERRIRLLVEQDKGPTGAIVDWFIEHSMPILGMQMNEVTLQEVYEYYLEAAGDA